MGLLEETCHIFELADGTKSYPVGIVKYVEVHIGRLKLLNDFYVIDMKKDPETPLLVGRGFLATANAVIDCRKAKIVVGEGITRSVFGVKGVNLEPRGSRSRILQGLCGRFYEKEGLKLYKGFDFSARSLIRRYLKAVTLSAAREFTRSCYSDVYSPSSYIDEQIMVMKILYAASVFKLNAAAWL
ncbi:retrotransposon protein, putative, ty3-gypsy subclass [Tanacetum coccineum]